MASGRENVFCRNRMLACYTRFVLVTIYVCRSRGSTKRVFSKAVSLLCAIFNIKSVIMRRLCSFPYARLIFSVIMILMNSSVINFLSELFNSSPKAVTAYFDMLQNMLKGAGTSLSIFALTLFFAVPLALFICMGRMSSSKLVSVPVNWLLLVIRGTPLMLQLLIVYFGPGLIAKNIFHTTLGWSSSIAAVVAFSINYACYFSEIYRGGIESIPKGQYEASKVLGYTKFQTFWKIVLPQVIKRIVPAMGNEVITLVKDTSLVTIISIQELMYVAKSNSNRMVSFMPLLIAGIFYFVMNYVVAFAFHKLEEKLDYYK